MASVTCIQHYNITQVLQKIASASEDRMSVTENRTISMKDQTNKCHRNCMSAMEARASATVECASSMRDRANAEEDYGMAVLLKCH